MGNFLAYYSLCLNSERNYQGLLSPSQTVCPHGIVNFVTIFERIVQKIRIRLAWYGGATSNFILFLALDEKMYVKRSDINTAEMEWIMLEINSQEDLGLDDGARNCPWGLAQGEESRPLDTKIPFIVQKLRLNLKTPLFWFLSSSSFWCENALETMAPTPLKEAAFFW